MGFLRTYLALCVVESHYPGTIPWCGLGGKIAVQLFFMISGYYMAFAQPKYESIASFYKSRFFRIFPPYLLILSITLLIQSVTGMIFGEWGTLQALRDQIRIQGLHPSVLLAAFTNVTLAFQDFTLFFSDSATGIKLVFSSNSEGPHLYRFLLLPVSWTISLELYFYLLVPILNRWTNKRLLVVMLGLLTLRGIAAVFGVSSSPWDYRFFPFEMAFFLAGILACRWTPAISSKLCLSDRRFAHITVISALVLIPFHIRTVQLSSFALPLTMLAGLVILPLLFTTSKSSRLDRAVGELSYPVYLFHMLIGWLVVGISKKLGIAHGPITGLIIFAMVFITAIMANIYVFNPLETFRKRFKTKAVNSLSPR